MPNVRLAKVQDNSHKEEENAAMQRFLDQRPWEDPFYPRGTTASITGVTDRDASPRDMKKQASVGEVNANFIAGQIQDSVDDKFDEPRSDDHSRVASLPRSSSIIRADLEEAPGGIPSIKNSNSHLESSTSGIAHSFQIATKRGPGSSSLLETSINMSQQQIQNDSDDEKSTGAGNSQKVYSCATIKLFTKALADMLSETLPEDLRLPYHQRPDIRTVLGGVESQLDYYCAQIRSDSRGNWQIRQAARKIRRLNITICQNALNVFKENNGLERTVKKNVFMPSLIDGGEESSDGLRSNEKEDELSHSSKAWQDIKSDDEKDSSADSMDDQGVYDYLVGHRAFSILQKGLHAIVEPYLGDQTQLISLQILRTFRQSRSFRTVMGGGFPAIFATNWDLEQFLEYQYPKGCLQSLRDVLAITGNSENSQMCTVEQYLRQNWTKYTFELVDHLTYVISAGANGTTSDRITYLPEDRIIRVDGPEDFIVTIGQQLAWLGAACRNSNGQLAFCYTAFTVKTSEGLCPMFRLQHETSSSGIEDSNSCWHDLVGDSVIAYGFPILERPDEIHGLHLPTELMAVLGRIPFATYFDGGYVLKGRSFVIVPLQRRGASVQWHLFQNKDRSRIEYEDLLKLAPNRLLTEKHDGLTFLSTESYLGWCSQCNVNLATENYDYHGIKYTKSESKSRLTISADSFMIGFQQWGSAGVNFTLGRHQGFYRNEPSEFCRDLLNDASNMHVVLQDMEAHRAWHTDAETMILHIILHRYELAAFNVGNYPVHLERAKFDDPKSVREAMFSNRDTSIEIDKHLQETGVNDKQFSHVVNELFQVFDGLQATQRQITRKSGFEFNGLRGRDVCGWEYLDIVNRAHHPEYRCAQLKETCGEWPELMRQLNAVVLYGSFFQDVFEPSHPAQTCMEFRHLPQGKDYLAMQVAALNRLYHESGTLSNDDEMARITSKGTRLCPSKYLYDPCPCNAVGNLGGSNDNCLSDRIQYLDFKSNKKITKLAGLGETGAFIIGKRSNTSKIWDKINKSRAKAKNPSYLHTQGMSNASSRMNKPRTSGITAVSSPSVAVTSSLPQPASPLSRTLTISQAPDPQTPLLCQQSPTSQQVP